MKKLPAEIANDPNVDDNNRAFFWHAMQDPKTRASIKKDMQEQAALHGEDFDKKWAEWLKWLCIDE